MNAHKPAPGPTLPTLAGRVLVVDDNDDARELALRCAGKLGLATLEARDGATAVDMALREQPDAVLLDVQMPGMDGFAAARAMRSGGYRGTIIALTGLGEETAHALRNAGCDVHIVKPVRTVTLHAALAGRLALQRTSGIDP